jgi:preprotein translocase subunit SecA
MPATRDMPRPSRAGNGRRPSAAPPVEAWRMLSDDPAAEVRLPKGLDAAWNAAAGRVRSLTPRRRIFLRRAARVVDREQETARLSDARLRERARDLHELFRLGRERPADVDEAAAVVREVASRTIGLKPFVEQVAAGLAMHAGCVAEMATGEGKTLAATLPAVLAGWRGRGCHIITVNDYLAGRDDDSMGPIYRFCGLTVSHVAQEMTPADRRQAYARDITYCTNKEVAADFLRDRLALGRSRRLADALLAGVVDGRGAGVERLLLRGLHTAIVDEADSILIDEAVTPLIISGGGPNNEQVEAYQRASDLADAMEPGEHYRVDHRYREVNLTRAGQARLAALSADLGGVWAGVRRREELVAQALTARELFARDQQYIVRDDQVVIVDEFTGRLMPDRTWRSGMHQAVEAKERLEVNAPKETLARISFQRFFRLYRHLAGMTGTAWEARHEMWQIYRMPTVVLPTHRPCIRVHPPDRVFTDEEAKWRAAVEEVVRLHATGRPVLIGTRSVEASELLSGKLAERGLEHRVLNAVRHAEEAMIVAEAGHRARITVATNMAGRGTDIKLERAVAALGGLCVLATERHEAGRIDRQLAGRAGRQGDPGTAVSYVSLDDELLRRHAPRAARAWRRRHAGGSGEIDDRASAALFADAQKRAQRLALRQRRLVLRQDDWLDEHLGFAGKEL